jgi:hypothetical protein
MYFKCNLHEKTAIQTCRITKNYRLIREREVCFKCNTFHAAGEKQEVHFKCKIITTIKKDEYQV